jgi:two-component system NarL family sensor kinase
MDLRGHKRGATLRITDTGNGMSPARRKTAQGLGLRNMQERMDQLNGSLRLRSKRGGGTVIEVSVPFSHMLPPESANTRSQKMAAQ